MREQYDRMKTMPSGCMTFINPIDREIGAIRKGTMMTIAGFAGQFKTTTGLSILYSNMIELNQNGVFISLEMPKELIWYYIYARHSYHEDFQSKGDPLNKRDIVHGNLTEEQEKFLFEVVELDFKSRKGRIEVLDRTDFKSMDPIGIRSRLSQLPFQIDYLIVDYMQMFRFLKEAQALKDPENSYVSFFQSMSVEFDGNPISVILLAQTNRAGFLYATEHDGEYMLTALAELNALERDSSYVVFLYTDDDLKDSQELKINLPKNRFGSSFQVPITTFVDGAYNIVGDFIEGVGETSQNVDFTETLLDFAG